MAQLEVESSRDPMAYPATDREVYYTFISKLLPAVDVPLLFLVVGTSTRPVMTFLLIICMPVLGRLARKIGERINKKLDKPLMLTSGLILCLLCSLSGTASPAWLFGMPAIVAAIFLVPEMRFKLLFALYILLATILGNYLSGRDSLAILSATLALFTFAVLLLRTYQYLCQINTRLEAQRLEIQHEQEKSERLLENILPHPIAVRMKSGETMIADQFVAVTVLFADIVGFTKLSATITPQNLVTQLDQIFSEFDHIADKYGLEKIKTIGDAYMAVSGVPQPRPDHLETVAQAALEMQNAVQNLSVVLVTKLQVRIGIHTGNVVAGVIGERKFAYDLWGDTVNTASRMESHGEAGKIHCSEAVYEYLKEKYVFESRGKIDVKGKGIMETYFLVRKINSD